MAVDHVGTDIPHLAHEHVEVDVVILDLNVVEDVLDLLGLNHGENVHWPVEFHLSLHSSKPSRKAGNSYLYGVGAELNDR